MLSRSTFRDCCAAVLATVVSVASCTPTANRDTSAPLANRYWRLVELNGRPALTTGTTSDPFLRFSVDSSRVTGNTGCNLLTGPFTHDGESLRFGALITTKRACAEAERNKQESDFAAVLGVTQRYAVSGDTLTLFGPSGVVARLVAGATP